MSTVVFFAGVLTGWLAAAFIVRPAAADIDFATATARNKRAWMRERLDISRAGNRWRS